MFMAPLSSGRVVIAVSAINKSISKGGPGYSSTVCSDKACLFSVYIRVGDAPVGLPEPPTPVASIVGQDVSSSPLQ